MGYDAKVFNVMIASPGGLDEEREAIRKCIHTWNANNSEHRKIVLLPLGWESHSSPEMGAHPQTIINRQVLEKADLLVGLFWTRIGTKTKNFPSGTVEEIETHSLLGKPTMLYFSDKSAPPSEIDPDQYSAVKDYKVDLGTRSLYNSYTTLVEFKEKFAQNLAKTVNDHPLFNGTSSENLRKPAPARDVQKIYSLAANARSELLSFKEITGEKLFKITGRYGLSRWGKDANKLEPEVAAMYKKEHHQWFDEFTKEYHKKFDATFKKLIELISSEAEHTPAFNGYADRLKNFPKNTDDMSSTRDCLTEIVELAEAYADK